MEDNKNMNMNDDVETGTEPATEPASESVVEPVCESTDTDNTSDGIRQEEADNIAPGVAPIEEWVAALETAVRQRDEYLALAQRVQADFDNFRRRNASVRAESFEDGKRDVISAILPVLDNLERALLSANSEGATVKSITDGVDMVLKLLTGALTNFGFAEVPALNEVFDPEKHNAVMRAPVDEGEPGTISEVFQKGYKVKERIIRYAMVKVVAED